MHTQDISSFSSSEGLNQGPVHMEETPGPSNLPNQHLDHSLLSQACSVFKSLILGLPSLPLNQITEAVLSPALPRNATQGPATVYH